MCTCGRIFQHLCYVIIYYYLVRLSTSILNTVTLKFWFSCFYHRLFILNSYLKHLLYLISVMVMCVVL